MWMWTGLSEVLVGWKKTVLASCAVCGCGVAGILRLLLMGDIRYAKRNRWILDIDVGLGLILGLGFSLGLLLRLGC